MLQLSRGITGIATSYMLGKAGVKVAVIEADRILQGTTAIPRQK